MTRHTRRFPILSLVIAALLLGGAAVAMSAGQGSNKPAFTEAEIFLELNDTHGDLGIHSSLDGGVWTNLTITGPNGLGQLLSIDSSGALQTQGLTQLSFESAEPPFDELAPADFFRRFPAGPYTIQAIAQAGDTFQATATLSHVLAAPPENIRVGGVPAAESCDARPLPRVSAPVLIDWDPVTRSHPEFGAVVPVQVSRYQLFVEGTGVKFSLDLPPTVTQFQVPTGVTALGTEFKFEIIARTSTGNNTAIESCFRMR
jgi:hypothetical protein